MTAPTLDEVFDHSMVTALNPMGQRFLRRVDLPTRLNPFAEAGVTVSAVLAFGEFAHIKTVPTFEMMYEDFMAGLYKGKHTIVIDSSGNTAHAVVRLAPAFGLSNVIVVMSADVPAAKRNVFAALSTPTIISVPKGRSVAQVARELGERPGHHHLDQYSHPGNARAHELYTGPELCRLFGDELSIIAIAMGSGGTAAGVGAYVREHYPLARVLGVRPRLGQQVPGARDQKKMEEVVRIPWEDHVHTVVEVDRKTAFAATRSLWNAVEPQPGPTSGLAYQGLVRYLMPLFHSDFADLRFVAGKTVAFICPDSAMLYSDVITAELDADQGI